MAPLTALLRLAIRLSTFRSSTARGTVPEPSTTGWKPGRLNLGPMEALALSRSCGGVHQGEGRASENDSGAQRVETSWSIH